MSKNVPIFPMKSLLDSIKQVPMPKLNDLLRKFDTARCTREIDFQRMLLAKLFYFGFSTKSLTNLHFPDWTLNINEYKASYYFYKRQVARHEIFFEELCQIDWNFSYVRNGIGFDTQSTNKFTTDYMYCSPRLGGSLPWQFVTNEGEQRRIHIDNFRPLSSRRLHNGLWLLENQFVALQQVTPLDAASLPFLDDTLE